MTDQLHATVRDHYALEARRVLDAEPGAASCGSGCGCGAGIDATEARSLGYGSSDLSTLPDTAVLASLGCGNPTAVAELRPGETVLDLGSGGGIDVLLSAQRVGPTGRAIGLDMTDEMLELANRNAAAAGATNVTFLKGTIEAVPVPAASVDVVISNCVINLAADKPAVFAEIARILRPGGRIGVADIVADDALSADERAARGSYAGCIAGALSYAEYVAGLQAVGLVGIEITATQGVVDGMANAIIRAHRPALGEELGAGPAPRVETAPRPVLAGTSLPMVQGCC